MLERIQSPGDVKKLNDAQSRQLCDELRNFLIEEVSHTGGHLASNLGVVELTVAIHRVFDTQKDRLVFDVGHQCYVHKALTGRRELFDTLRQFGGISGFPKPYESEHDAFIAGHASNSVSVALSMARARTLQHQHYQVVALIGDGALGGGLSFEGLNNAGASGEPMIVILNDNGMSINRNVGALSKHLAKLRTRPEYYNFKKWYRDITGTSKVGKTIYRASHTLKETLKKSVVPGSTFFEEMGFTYMGPVDGHDVEKLTEMLRWAKEMKCPVLLHVNTVKGKGYPFAENNPGRFHGVSPFNPLTGKPLQENKATFSSVFGETVADLAAGDDKVCAITAAMADGTGLTSFAKLYPTRFFDVGIAEGHAVSMAAGMAKQGLHPVFAVYSSFLQRGYDMMIHDVALDNLHVVFAVDRAGLVGADGETHHGCFDALYLSQIPHITVLCPSNFSELRYMLRIGVEELTGPVAVRYPRGGEGSYQAVSGRADIVELRSGNDITLFSYGVLINNLLDAAEQLSQLGISASVLKLNCIAPLDSRVIAESVRKTKRLLVLEDCMGVGCVGQRIAAILAQEGIAPDRLILKNLGTTFATQGNVDELEHAFGLDAKSIVESVLEVCHERKDET
ncbi:MAG: 1-deoxy-D-xylulose-5-phosphate synthase [Clostridiales bacterium]|nr:1-deoxy-D-xylulose-5-phosphate synthase [Clostridiales bacterium]